MAEPKTKPTDASVKDFINSLENETRRKDSHELVKLYSRVTGQKPKMWGSSIVGFDVYSIKTKSSSKAADWPLAAFSPRKQSMTLYVYPKKFPELLEGLGKHKATGGCLYINSLEDIDLKVLEKLVAASYAWSKETYL